MLVVLWEFLRLSFLLLKIFNLFIFFGNRILIFSYLKLLLIILILLSFELFLGLIQFILHAFYVEFQLLFYLNMVPDLSFVFLKLLFKLIGFRCTLFALRFLLLNKSSYNISFAFMVIKFHTHQDFYWRLYILYDVEGVNLFKFWALIFKLLVIILVNLNLNAKILLRHLNVF